MTTYRTQMQKEAAEAPDRIAQQLAENRVRVERLRDEIRRRDIRFIMIVGRGSSDHAGVFAKYLLEIETGIPVFAAAPSVTTLYGRSLHLAGALVLVISQSGRSPDIVAQAEQARRAGAYVVALVNDEHSPLARSVDFVLPLGAGPETSVAATKSYLTTLSAVLQLAAALNDDLRLRDALKVLPDQLRTVIASPEQLSPSALERLDHLIVLGRGLGFAIAKEMALKLKEVCGIHAEAFSSAEFLHGPVALANRPLTAIDILVNDESAAAHRSQIAEIGTRGVHLVHLNQVVADAHPRVAPLLILQRFYLDVAEVALALGLNPDQPGGLKKVTETL